MGAQNGAGREHIEKAKVLVLLSLAAGASRKAAAGMAGVSYRTLARWQADDEQFADAVEVATGQGRSVYEAILRQAAEKDWRAAVAAYELVYLGGQRANSRHGVVDPEAPPLLSGPPSDLFKDESAEQREERVGRVLSLVRMALRDDDGSKTEEVVERNARRLVDGRKVVS